MALGFFLTVTLLLLVLSFPIFLAILAGTIGSFELFGPPMPTKVIAQRLVEGVNIFSLLAVPLFVFAADIVARGQIGRRLVRLMEVLVGHVTGGLAIATVLTCGLFGAKWDVEILEHAGVQGCGAGDAGVHRNIEHPYVGGDVVELVAQRSLNRAVGTGDEVDSEDARKRKAEISRAPGCPGQWHCRPQRTLNRHIENGDVDQLVDAD